MDVTMSKDNAGLVARVFAPEGANQLTKIFDSTFSQKKKIRL